MYKISMPSRIIDALVKCLNAKGVNPVVSSDPPKNKTLEVANIEEFAQLGLCLKEFNQQIWGDVD